MRKLFSVVGIILMIISAISCEKKSTPPSISTNIVTRIATTAAVSGGNITADGGAPVILRGVCWNTSDFPTTEDSKTTDNVDLLTFSSNITQLAPNTYYYVRAYATNNIGTGYGKSVLFKTLGDKPESNDLNASNITINSASLTGSVNANHLSTTVTFEYGVSTSYGNTATPLESPVSGETNGNIAVKADLSGLTPGTTYLVRIKAENSLGVTYSSNLIFTTLGKVPDVTIPAVTDLQVKAATISGSVNPNFLPSTVTFEWGTSIDYGNSVTPVQSPLNGSAAVNVSTILTGLTPGTIYHFRIKASNELGTAYSNDFIFKTFGQIPLAVTQPVTNLQVNQVRINGLVNAHYLPTEVFFEWGSTLTYGNTSAHNYIEGNTPVNIFTDLSGLSPETTYHFRIKATNELGTVFSDDLTFKTFAAIDADGNYYNSVIINTQTWMTGNLKTSKYNNGDLIGTTNPNSLDITGESTPKYQWAALGNESNVSAYGRLYTWYVIEDSRGICPAGWHVPSESEWIALVDYLGGERVAGSELKETGNSHWNYNTDATNESGFTALPAGLRISDGTFWGASHAGVFLTTTPFDPITSRTIFIYADRTNIDYALQEKNKGQSIRCIKD